jgi:predicted phosphoadenosine phosphosulfate sulfurtransferase
MTKSVRVHTGLDVFEQAYMRLFELYRDGHTVVVAFSAGKDSGICLELAIMAARAAGRLPVHVNMRDEEIMFPGTFEYAERVAARTDEVDFHWAVANQPIVNVFNRKQPYWWVFDPALTPEQWVRQPPAIARHVDALDITRIITREVYPTAPGKDIFAVVGLRVSESQTRRYSVFAAGGHLTKPNAVGTRNCRPIYDWQDGDVWRAIRENGWDYNHAYDVMFRFNVPMRFMRIAPPTLNAASASTLEMARRAWPRWFDRVEDRLPGVKTVAQFGMRSVMPYRRSGETWEQCFMRECINEAPAPWIRERAAKVMNAIVGMHRKHSTTELPDARPCYMCVGNMGSWRTLAFALYNGDPFAMKTRDIGGVQPIEPEFFRPGAGTWGGFAPTWS